LRHRERSASSLKDGLSEPGRLSPPIWPCTTRGFPCSSVLLPGRWALTPPFHPCLTLLAFRRRPAGFPARCHRARFAGGLFSVALSVNSSTGFSLCSSFRASVIAGPQVCFAIGGRTFRSDINISNINRALAPEELILLLPSSLARLFMRVAASLRNPAARRHRLKSVLPLPWCYQARCPVMSSVDRSPLTLGNVPSAGVYVAPGFSPAFHNLSPSYRHSDERRAVNVPHHGVRTFLPSSVISGLRKRPIYDRDQRSPGSPANPIIPRLLAAKAIKLYVALC